MDDKVPFLTYSRRKLGSAAGKSYEKTKDVENDSELKDLKSEATVKTDGQKRTMSTGNPKIDGEGGALTDITKRRNEDRGTPLKRKKGADVEITLACLSYPERNTSRLRRRKEVLSFRKVDLCDNDNRRIIGKRVKVYWSGSRRWFIGRVKAFHNRKRLHTILYEDGDKEELDLRKERFELEILPTESFCLRMEPNYGKKLINAGAELSKGHSVEVDDARKLTVKKDNELNEDAIRGNSKSHLEKDTKDVGRMDAVAVPEKADVLVTDEVSSKMSEVENKTTKTFGAQVTEFASCSKIKDTVSGYNIGGENVLKDFSKEAEDGEPQRRGARSKKNMALRDSKVGSSKSHCKEGSKEMKRADLDQDVHHNFVNTNLGQYDFNVEGCQRVDDQEKRRKKTESPDGKAIENHGISYKTQPSNSGSDGAKEEDGFYGVRVKWEIGEQAENLTSLNRKEEDPFPYVGSISRDVNVRRPRTAKTNEEMKSFLKAGKRKSESGKSGKNLSKEKVLARKKAWELIKCENNGNAESLKNPIRRRRSAVVLTKWLDGA